MKKPSYLNCVLTAIAILLAALVWTHVADRPMLAAEASANFAPPTGVPNAGLQRAQIRDAVVDLQKEVQKLNKMMTGGVLKVEVTNIADLAREDDDDDDDRGN